MEPPTGPRRPCAAPARRREPRDVRQLRSWASIDAVSSWRSSPATTSASLACAKSSSASSRERSSLWRSGELRPPPIQPSLAITQQWTRATDVRPVYEACEAVALCRRPTRGVIEVKRIFDFLKSRGARMSCPFCGQEQWHGWDERVALEHVTGSKTVDRGTEAFPLTCANCGFIRFQSAHVLDDPRAATRNEPEE